MTDRRNNFTIVALILGWHCIVVLAMTLYPFSFFPANALDTARPDGVHFGTPSIMIAEPGSRPLPPAGTFTLLFRITPMESHDGQLSTLVTNSTAPSDRNFSVHQAGRSLLFRMRNGGITDLYTTPVVRAGRPAWYALVYDGTMLRWYVDGVVNSERHIGVIDRTAWNAAYPLVAGSEANGYHQWNGVFHHFAVYDRPLNDGAPAVSGGGSPPDVPRLEFRFGGLEGAMVRSTGTDTTVVMRGEGLYAPFRRTFLLESTTEWWKRRILFRDVFANIALFIPFGFLAGMLAMIRRVRPARSGSVITAAGLLFSLGIEALQSFVPGRFSSLSDVVSNTAGAFIGWALLLLILRTMRRPGPTTR